MIVLKYILLNTEDTIMNKNTKKKRTITFLLILIVAGAVFFFWFMSRDKPYTFINYDAPTKQEKAAGDEKKKELVEENQNQSESQPVEQAVTDKAKAEIIITSAAQFDEARTATDTSDDLIDVRAYIPNRYEKGMCTITLTRGDLKVVKEAPAYPDASYTICTNPLIKRAELAEPGDWQVAVTYSSDTAFGEATQTIRGVK